ncbi:MAG: 16S rRNA (cytosine(1402)-N(4))-methyltransferase RsmH [Candidatus Moranbacteria bacterium]|nr:16S rRNA (cytosine(1402)-N(4))-methyltransferase RsmH [Candidatus Moranbacteria bacterium]
MVEIRHVPVLLRETVDGLRLGPGDTVVDGTLGSGGHSLELFEKVFPGGRLIAMDMDALAIERFKRRIAPIGWAKQALDEGQIQLFHANFSEIADVLDEAKAEKVSGIMVDLGFSSDQMDAVERGLSFSSDGPLDMRLNQENPLTAQRVIAEYSEERLTQILKEYSEERFARNIAQAIVKERSKISIMTTKALAEIVQRAIPKRYHARNIHPATKAFQALRIEVNEELLNLKTFLPQAIGRLAPGGRLAVISFHSGEDRIVKQFFQENARGCICPKEFPICRCDTRPNIKKVTAKPIVPSDAEVASNPRSRSAKLRIVEKL